MDNRELDIARTRYLETQGYQVIRFWNNQVFEEMEGVLTALTLALSPGGGGDVLREGWGHLRA